MSLLWPDMPLESAQVNLRQTIYRLRQAIPEVTDRLTKTLGPLIRADRLMIEINPSADITIDVDEFEEAIAVDPAVAVAQYRGDFLANFYVTDSSPYETWAQTLREKYRRQMLTALEKLCQDQLQQGNYDQAQSYAWRQLEIEPLREQGYRQLMMALASGGQRDAALAQYQVCTRKLKEELDIEPSTETRRLYEQIQSDAYREIQKTTGINRPSPAQRMPVFMLTDIESSTHLWDTYRQAMLTALLRHNSILEFQIRRHGGRILELRGDGVKAVFEDGDPLACVLAIQKEFARADWGEIGALKIRIGLHGVPTVRKDFDYFKEDDKYFGPVLNHTARIMDAGWGGQILVSEQVHNHFALPPGANWTDFGLQPLKSLENPVHILGLTHPDLPQQSFPPLRTLEQATANNLPDVLGPPHNLPTQPTQFIGRKNEIIALKGMLTDPDTRLVSLVGPGGMGKTRLALMVGESMLDSQSDDGAYWFQDGIFFIPFASIDKREHIFTAIANALNLTADALQTADTQGRTSQTSATRKELVTGYLAGKRILLILDNLEHLIEDSEFVADLLQIGPAIQILTTSRERLNLLEEQVFPIQGLEYPHQDTAEDPKDFTALALFLQTAKRIAPNIELEAEDYVHLTRICRLLAGMPLGLELAASWVDLLSPREIAEEIQKNIDFLESDIRNLPDRHRSMRLVIDASWNRLSDDEKQTLARLSFFRGPFSRVAAQEIAGASLRTLSTLTHKSLLRFDQDTHRYQIHELLRQYAAAILASRKKDADSVNKKFRTYWSNEVDVQFSLFMGGKTHNITDQLSPDLANIMTAWDLARDRTDIDRIIKFFPGLSVYYASTMNLDEGLSFCQEALKLVEKASHQAPEDPMVSRLHGIILNWKGYFYMFVNHDLARHLFDQSEAIVNELGKSGFAIHQDKFQIVFNRGLLAYLANDYKSAMTLLKEALDFSREGEFQWMVLRTLLVMSDVARNSGAPAEAKFWSERCLAEAKALGNYWGQINALDGLGWAARRLMAYPEAKAYFEESYQLASKCKRPWDMSQAQTSLGFLAIFLGHFETAFSRFSEAVAISEELGMPERVVASRIHLGIANWLSGDFRHAESRLNEILALTRDLSPAQRIFPSSVLLNS